MAKKIENFRDTVGKALEDSKQRVVEMLQKRLGPPPAWPASLGSSPAKADDEYRLFWKLGDGWPADPPGQQAKADQLYAQGAKPADVLASLFPARAELVVTGDRRDNLPAQVAFCDAMVARHAEVLNRQMDESMAVLSGGGRQQ